MLTLLRVVCFLAITSLLPSCTEHPPKVFLGESLVPVAKERFEEIRVVIYPDVSGTPGLERVYTGSETAGILKLLNLESSALSNAAVGCIHTGRVEAKIRAAEGQPAAKKVFDIGCERLLMDQDQRVYAEARQPLKRDLFR